MSDMQRTYKAARKHKRRRWQAERESAATPSYRVRGSWVVDGEGKRVAGPFGNAAAWRWIDQHTVARRYGARP